MSKFNGTVVELCVQRKDESPAVFTSVLSIAADAAQNGMTAQLLYQHETLMLALFAVKPAHTCPVYCPFSRSNRFSWLFWNCAFLHHGKMLCICVLIHFRPHHFAEHKVRSIAIKVVSVISVCVCICVCLLDTTVSPAKTAEPIEMWFGL